MQNIRKPQGRENVRTRGKEANNEDKIREERKGETDHEEAKEK